MGELEKRIHEISVKNCEDYHSIKKCNTFEQLYAIESTLTGVSESQSSLIEAVFLTKHFENETVFTDRQNIVLYRSN